MLITGLIENFLKNKKFKSIHNLDTLLINIREIRNFAL